ncbi:MAG: transglycosylase family protein [Acidimicrobiales bacterium]
MVALLAASAVIAMARPPRAGADQVGNLTAQARSISQQLVQEELEADAYQQQYSVATAQVAEDQRAIAATQLQIKSDRQQITERTHQVERIAIASYVLNGSVSSASGASLFAENMSTVQSANEYATVTIGNLNEAVDKLHAAQRSVQGTLQVLVRQSDRDRAEQTAQATYLAQSTSTVSHMESVQAQVTGQLAEAVAQQNAVLGQAAAAAVATAQKATVQKSTVQKSGGAAPTSSPGPAVVSVTTTDPALNPFLQCVVQAESGGDYQAVSPNGLYMGAFQFSQATWNYAAQAAGLSSLVGVPPNRATKAEQDTVAVALYALDGDRPWLGDRCSS